MVKARRKEREMVRAVKRKVRWMERGSLCCCCCCWGAVVPLAVPLARLGRRAMTFYEFVYLCGVEWMELETRLV